MFGLELFTTDNVHDDPRPLEGTHWGVYYAPFLVCEFIHNVMLDGTLTDDFILLFTLWEEY